MKVFITGAAGFVGQALVEKLIESEHEVFAGVRSFSPELPAAARQVAMGDIATDVDYEYASVRNDQQQPMYTCSHESDYQSVLNGIDVIVHTAARVHEMNDKSADPLAEFRRVNTVATLKLAHQAAKAGVKRFIFISTVKVNGESTKECMPFSEKNDCHPTDPYGISKLEAEQGLKQIAIDTGIEVVLIRPPLVYGHGVKGNFASMMKWLRLGVPLPFGAVKNKRSLLALDNLVSFITYCLDHHKAANETFLLSDGEDVSTTELIEMLSVVQGKKARLLPVPVSLMKFIAVALGKKDMANRLFDSLQIDSSKAGELLGWNPPITMDEQLRKMVD